MLTLTTFDEFDILPIKSYDSYGSAPHCPHAFIIACVTAKNTTQQNNRTTKENTVKFVINNAVIRPFAHSTVIQGLNNKMWQNTRHCLNIFGVLLNNTAIRGLKTSVVCGTAKSSPAQPGYPSEDKILQIKHHRNDYAEQYPSVTLILNKTMTEESRLALEKWKQERIAEMGVEEFNRFYQGK